jgi:phage terminase large subunit-like protein
VADPFLDEIRAMHELRAKARSATPEARAVLIGVGFDNDWTFAARDAQLPPADDNWWCWLLLGGRGAGKTHAESQAIHTAVRAGVMRIGLISTTTAVLDAVNLEGPSGLLKTAGSGPPPRVVQYKRRVEFMNGATVSLFSGEEPESLRGYQFEMVVIDELATMRYAQQVFDQAMLTLRLGEKPRMIIATTPRPTPFMLKLIAVEGVTITRSTTFDNAEHLSADALGRLRKAYEGASREWLQEIQGEMVLVPEGALFREEWLRHDDVASETIEQVTIGVDPSGGSDETGIVAAALLTDSRLAVLADRSLSGTPSQWGEAAVRAHDDFDADDVAVEVNYGGAMATDVIKQAAARLHEKGERESGMIRVKEVTASRGKIMRAEPMSLLFEQGRVLMRPGMPKLEAEMLRFSREWNRDVDGSPNRLDACVWALTRLSKVITNIPIA